MDRRTFTTGLAGLAALGLAGCGANSDPLGAEPSNSAGGGSAIVVGSADFTESVILAELYAQALVAKGVQASTKTRIGSREIYLKALQDGSIQVIPEYTGNLLQFLDASNTAKTPDEVLAALNTVVGEKLKVLKVSTANDSDCYVVTGETSTTQGITSLADLKKISSTSVIGGPSELKERPYGPPGLASIYGATFKEFRSYDSPAVKTKDLIDNKIQVSSFFTTEAAITDNGFVVLADPEQMILPQQVVPVVAAAVASNADAVAAIEAVQTALTTDNLAAMNKQVDVDHADPKTVAADFLKTNNLGA